MSQPNTYEEQVLDAKVDRIISTIKKVLSIFFFTVLAVITVIFVLELKREFQIDIFQGINFSIDDWYFDNIGSVK